MDDLSFREMQELYDAITADNKDFKWHAMFIWNRFGIQATPQEVKDWYTTAFLSGAFDK